MLVPASRAAGVSLKRSALKNGAAASGTKGVPDAAAPFIRSSSRDLYLVLVLGVSVENVCHKPAGGPYPTPGVP